MIRNFALFAVSCGLAAISISFPLAGLPQSVQTENKTTPLPSLPVACSADKPVVQEGGTVVLRAWAVFPKGESPDYHWTVTTGKVTGGGREVRWDFAAVSSDPHPFGATVKVTLPENKSASCFLQVFVAERERSGERETGRSFLVKGKKEIEGYGLYSYLLLGARPVDSNRERFVKTVEAYLGRIEEVTKLQDYIPPGKLNVAYLPLEITPVSNPSADWILDHYDYARARALLDLVPGTHREGPYIVSALKPLGSGDSTSQYLFQDLSAVPAGGGDLISWWIREFLNQAAQERFWEPRTAESLVLKLRTTIAVLATGFPVVQEGLDSFISWIH